MAVTRRRFLTRVAAAGGASLAYEAMTALGLLAAPSQRSPVRHGALFLERIYRFSALRPFHPHGIKGQIRAFADLLQQQGARFGLV